MKKDNGEQEKDRRSSAGKERRIWREGKRKEMHHCVFCELKFRAEKCDAIRISSAKTIKASEMSRNLSARL